MSGQNNALRNLVCFNFYKGWRGISEFYRATLPEGVSAQQSYILELCSLHEGVLVGDIASAMEIDLPAISSMLRRMEKSNLIIRKTNTNNRRQVYVKLTQDGANLKTEVLEKMIAADKKLRETISQDMIDELIRIVDQVRTL